MAQLLKCLLCKPENLSFSSVPTLKEENPSEVLTTVTLVLGGWPRTASLAKSIRSWFSERACLRKQGGKQFRKTCHPPPAQTYMCTLTHERFTEHRLCVSHCTMSSPWVDSHSEHAGKADDNFQYHM